MTPASQPLSPRSFVARFTATTDPRVTLEVAIETLCLTDEAIERLARIAVVRVTMPTAHYSQTQGIWRLVNIEDVTA